jgi:hypothetical protein
MRLSNPEDQKYVSKVVGDHFAGVIQMLPVLRPGEAFVIGDSVLMPMRTLVKFPNPPPQSANLDFFGAWSMGTENYDLDDIIDHWRRQDRQRLDPQEEADSVAALDGAKPTQQSVSPGAGQHRSPRDPVPAGHPKAPSQPVKPSAPPLVAKRPAAWPASTPS